MRRMLAAAMVLGLVSAALAQDGKQAVPIKRVVLFSSGVGYFEHLGSVTGDATTELQFKAEQINDILKSLVVMDLGKGTVSVVSYPTKDPLSRVLKSFQVDLTSNPSLKDLLNQVRGAEVKVWAPEAVTGKILGVEVVRRDLPNNQGVVEEPVLNIVLDGGTIQAVPLRTIQKLQLTDATLAAELTKALAALAAGRDKDKKPLTLSLKGQGERQVVIGYVVETPVWQTSYRLVLDEKQKPLLQGWAVVENTTENDWTQVSLSLVSGRPISFVQDLYTPLYVPRPVVVPELFASLRPRTYEEGISEKKPAEALAEAEGRFDRQAEMARARRAAPAPTGAAMAKAEAAYGGGGYTGDAARASVESLASAKSVGELFSYDIKMPVTVPRQRSAMLPIASNDVEAEKLSIYNMSVQEKYPLNGVKLKNITGLNLMAGPITVFDGGSYAGDARIDNLPPGDERLLSYALDLEVVVDATKVANATSLLGVKLSDGVLVARRKTTMTRAYVIKNKSRKDKTVVVEHPINQGWTLVKPEKADEKTPALYRFRVKAAAEKTETLEVVEERPYDERIALRGASTSQLEFWVSGKDASDAIKKALAKAIALKTELASLQKQMAEKEKAKADITAEQGRIRANMGTVDKASQYYNRLLTKLNDQETELEKLAGATKELQAQIDAKQKELDQYLLKLAAD